MTPILLLSLIPYSIALSAFVVWHWGFKTSGEGAIPAFLAAIFGGLICVHVMILSIVVTCAALFFVG